MIRDPLGKYNSSNNHVTQHIFYLQDIRRILDDLHLQKYQVDMVVILGHQELHSQNLLALMNPVLCWPWQVHNSEGQGK